MIRRAGTGVVGLALLVPLLAPQPAALAVVPPAPLMPATRAVSSALPRDTVLGLQTALARLAHPVPLTGGLDHATTEAVALLVDKYDWPTPDAVDQVVARRIVELARGVASVPARCRGAQVLCIDQQRLLLLVVEGDRIVERRDVRLGDSPAVNRAGTFRVTRKVASTVSTEYGAAMRDALFFDGARAIHFSDEFARTGYAGRSHGCVNLREAAVAHRLFVSTPVGTPVVVLPDTHAATTAAAVLSAMRAAGLPLDAEVSVSVRDITGGRGSGVAAARPVRPASNAKLLTGVAAVTTLGPGRRFTTRLRLAPHHRLVVVGGGDPGLTEVDVAALAARAAPALLRRGIARVRISADVSLFRGVPRPSGWPAGAQGESAGGLSALRFAGAHQGNGWRDVLRVLRRELASVGVAGRLAGRARVPAQGPTLAAHRGRTVERLVGGMLLRSESDTAEVLRAQVIRARGFDAGAVVRAVAASGIDVAGAVLADGSGLSSLDRVSTRMLTGLLVALEDPAARPALRRIAGRLPVAGRTGTLGAGSGRFVSPTTRCAAGRISAKTGTLAGRSVLSGYARDLGRHRVAFSISVAHAGLPARLRVAAVDAGAAAVVQCA